jgi:hypothetical protein
MPMVEYLCIVIFILEKRDIFMGGFFGAVSKEDCVFDLFYGVDYHSHLGTRRAGMAVYSKQNGFDKSIHK